MNIPTKRFGARTCSLLRKSYKPSWRKARVKVEKRKRKKKNRKSNIPIQRWFFPVCQRNLNTLRLAPIRFSGQLGQEIQDESFYIVHSFRPVNPVSIISRICRLDDTDLGSTSSSGSDSDSESGSTSRLSAERSSKCNSKSELDMVRTGKTDPEVQVIYFGEPDFIRFEAGVFFN